MVANLSTSQQTPIVYPSADGEPVAETYTHLYALLVTLEVLRQYLEGQQATVLGDPFLYYAQGFPRLRVAPDVMVIFGVEPGGRDNYKIWEEGKIPAVIFEMTSPGTKKQNEGFKYTLYEQLGVQEYWLFDPKGEWIEGQLQGYRLRGNKYEAIADSRSELSGLQLRVEGELIGFYWEDTEEKLLIPGELAQALKQETAARQQVEKRAEQAEVQLEKLRAKLETMGIDADAES